VVGLERRERAQPDEMQGPRGLPAAEEPCVARKAADDRGGHRRAGGDLQRREQEDHREVRQLLQRVVDLAGLVLGEVSVEVGGRGVEGVGDDRPRGRHESPPLARREQQRDVDQAGEHPELHGHEVPVAREPEVLAAGERDHRRPGLLLVQRRPRLTRIRAEDLLAEPRHLAARRAVIAQVELGQRAEHLDAAARQQREEEEVEEVGDDHPDGEM
jgi:hypothetical protein